MDPEVSTCAPTPGAGAGADGGRHDLLDAVVDGPGDPGGGDLGAKNRRREREPAGNTYLGLGADARGLGWAGLGCVKIASPVFSCPLVCTPSSLSSTKFLSRRAARRCPWD